MEHGYRAFVGGCRWVLQVIAEEEVQLKSFLHVNVSTNFPGVQTCKACPLLQLYTVEENDRWQTVEGQDSAKIVRFVSRSRLTPNIRHSQYPIYPVHGSLVKGPKLKGPDCL